MMSRSDCSSVHTHVGEYCDLAEVRIFGVNGKKSKLKSFVALSVTLLEIRQNLPNMLVFNHVSAHYRRQTRTRLAVRGQGRRDDHRDPGASLLRGGQGLEFAQRVGRRDEDTYSLKTLVRLSPHKIGKNSYCQIVSKYQYWFHSRQYCCNRHSN